MNQSKPTPMLTTFKQTGNTVSYVLKGVMNIQSVSNFWHQILEKLVEHDRVNLYIEDEDVDTFKLNAVLIVTLFPIEYADRFNKIAFVTEGKLNNSLEKLEAMLSQVNIKNFSLAKRKDAIRWVAS